LCGSRAAAARIGIIRVVSRIVKSTRIVPAGAADALTRAKVVLAEAEAKAEAARAEARREGLAAGREEGLAQLTELLLKARVAAAAMGEGATADLKRLAVRIAEKILGRELATSPEAIVDVVRAALDAARARKELVVRVHPEDAAAIQSSHPRLATALLPNAVLAVRGDADVPRGGCQIDTEVGTIDARLEVQLAAIERALLGDA
jgi:flagellar biosynthesis/type III secretory pathway protein FliH